MSDHTERERQRGINARLLLETPLLVESLAETKADLIAAWEATPARDTEGRERLWMMVKLLAKIPLHLETVMAGGTLAEHELTQIEAKKRGWKVFG